MEAPTGDTKSFRFGSFELDLASRELKKGRSAAVRLQQQPFEILRLMLERPGKVVTRDEIQQHLWPNGTFVDFEHSINAAVKRLREALDDDADNPRFVETLPRRGYRFIAALNAGDRERAAGTVPRLRLAVLPFMNLSDDGAQEYFTDGLTEEMIAQLGQLYRGRIGVIARWSSMVFKGTSQRVSEIGRTLGADYLLEGSVRRTGDRVRITARLVESSAETDLWTETYERHVTDCIGVQTEVAQRIAHSLALEFPSGQPLVNGGVSVSALAYQSYLRGRYEWNRPGDEGVDQALAHFVDALRIEPGFAAAHAGVARMHIARAEGYRGSPRIELEAARSSAVRALELDPQQSEGHLALGDVRRMLERDWSGASASYARAIDLNPSQENAYRARAMMLIASSRTAEAIQSAERACELDPLCLVVGSNAAWVSYLAGDHETALERCRRSLDLDPQHLLARRVLAAVWLRKGRPLDAVRVLEAARARDSDDPVIAAWLVHAKAMSGDRRGAVELLFALRGPDGERWRAPYHVALAQVGLGDIDGAFTSLDLAVADCDPALASLALEPRFDPIRSDPRFARVIAALGID
ncbi:MAG TPA: winged helix-turn-helix domain-containing protein [Vicinamibacterales bacterium]|nr:winged helix-turn-helix domain-containing protein [Vicinamibacterales bacterium]